MARGVSQEDFAAAADALLTAGERPTVERVRLALGRGSPNTLGPMLDIWWAGLARRLRTQLALPGVPEELGSAFAQLWAHALAAGQAHAEAQVAPERAALAEVMTQAEAASAEERAARARLEQQLAAALSDAKAFQSALAISEQRNSDLLRELAGQKENLQALSVRLDATSARHHLVVQQAETERAAAAAERESLQAHVRQVEERAYGEVDRTRQELKAMKAQLAALSRDHATVLRGRDLAQRQADSALQKAQRENATLRARLVKRPTPARQPRKA